MSSSSIARRRALVEVAAARQQAEFDRIIADKENERVRLEAEEELRRKCARAQHGRDMAVLASQKATAVADARLEAIEQSIVEERASAVLEEAEPADTRSRTQKWVNAHEKVDGDGYNAMSGMMVDQTRPTRVTQPLITEPSPIGVMNQIPPIPTRVTQPLITELPPTGVMNQIPPIPTRAISGEMCLDRIGGLVHISACRTSVVPHMDPLFAPKSENNHERYEVNPETTPCPNYLNVKEQHSEDNTDSVNVADVYSTTPRITKQVCPGKTTISLK